MILLQRCIGATESRHDGDAVLHGGGADFDFVFARVLAAGGVDDEGHVLVLYQVDDVRALAAREFWGRITLLWLSFECRPTARKRFATKMLFRLPSTPLKLSSAANWTFRYATSSCSLI